MRISLAALGLLLLAQLSNGNELRQSLQGSWLCTKIVDKTNTPTPGKYGYSEEYLKFSFQKGSLAIMESPFDPILVPFYPTYYKSHFSIFQVAEGKYFEENSYYLKSVDEEHLVLAAPRERDTIYYHFNNENIYLNKFDPGRDLIDMGIVMIRHLGGEGGSNKVSSYIIPNSPEFLFPSPVFKEFLGHYVSWNFNMPDEFMRDSVSNDVVVKLNFSDRGLTSFTITQGIGSVIDAELVRILEKSRKEWTPLRIKGKRVPCQAIIRFAFYHGSMNTRITIKKDGGIRVD